ncbi:polyribonucleotide nucleotidyltransferase [Bacillus timonensis]|nr:polyribonucleotide nucleotidyltransferase [Bacillus timonensis]
MKLSSFMANNVVELQRTLRMSLLQGQMATQTAHATEMMKDLSQAQASSNNAPHPTSGKHIDIQG